MKIFKMHAGHMTEYGKVQSAVRFNKPEVYYSLYQEAFESDKSVNQLFNEIFEMYLKRKK